MVADVVGLMSKTARRGVSRGPRSATTVCKREAQGRVTPDSFTHGTRAQRVRWFGRGIESGSIDDCGTYKKQGL